jgi:hypothetical protein
VELPKRNVVEPLDKDDYPVLGVFGRDELDPKENVA